MKIRQFQFLVALKEFGSISKVAEELFTSQPAVSIAIRDLEQELGYPLLKRSNRGVAFTQQGQQVLEQAENILQALNKITGITSFNGDELEGRMHMGAVPHLCNTILMDVQLELKEKYPQFTFSLEGADTLPLIHRVEESAMNLALIQLCDVDEEIFFQKVRDEKLQYGDLFTDRLFFTVADNHPLLRKSHVTVEDISRFGYCSFSQSQNQPMLQLTRQYHISAPPLRFFEMARMRRHMMLYNTYTVLPERAISHGNLNYCVKFCPLEIEGICWSTRVGWIHGPDPLNEAERRIIDEVLRIYGNPVYLSGLQTSGR